ncbi:ABC transporter permease subunit [Mesorhizobium sp.]|uniref:amino acid ABC transporter permease n=1 Tax=Mesorhizobium sp. TaxID=1871066 RepID=UPI000FE46559|nr:ABC transporter permease subunit [Mesorhizobium sp.]RWK40942.1 MAG: ABC transporter permease subunit [Mesorhizobium sp.]RWK67585.1 MAG: ABC transporter permease subunit [Mesorhizobium sp.]RWK79154.1 MAG: ABC transporter permease subunit [Mesorhizobium sp.]RWK84035.1 MAG: ABC transporter permease subunit [Mesorhizobium sp.]RWL05435.1 MAG: ABC transporter permease subunit [Mesorhizobium sp.]
MLASLWYSERARNWTAQICLLLACVALFTWLYDNTVTNLTARGIRVGLDFLGRQANFPISESVVDYDPSDTFFWAFAVGLTNTLFLSLIAIVLSTLLGLLVGLGRRSSNPLTAAVTGVYITAIRNTPLIVQLLFWYALATTALPSPRNAFNPVAGIFVSLRGVYLPRLHVEGDTNLLWAIAAVGAALLVAGIRYRRSHERLTPRLISMAIVAYLAAAIGIAAIAGLDASVTLPELKGFNFVGGMRLSSEFSAIIIGLVIYTSAFIAEIIRGGIDAVGKGQWEAGRAIGLTDRQTLSKIVIPQALRIIIPPLTTQYLSTVKNTTLALAVGYPELGLVVGTVINQTGQAIESIVIMLAVFLSISLSVSLFMNWYNRRVALVQR